MARQDRFPLQEGGNSAGGATALAEATAEWRANDGDAPAIARQSGLAAPPRPNEPARSRPEEPRVGATAPKRGRKRLVLLAFLLVAAAAAAFYGQRWWTVGRFQVSTDDAYVRADMTLVAAKVSGYVTAVPIDSNQRVKVGDVIARIDDGDYQFAVQAVRDKLATQDATIARIAEQVRAAGAAIDQARAQLSGAQADATRAALELERQNKLAQSDYTSRQRQENARADRDRAEAGVKGAEAGLASAKANVAVLQAQRAEAEHVRAAERTELAKAERDLSFTEVKAQVDGVIGNKAVQVGQLVQAGARLAAIVPLDSVYVDANFKETQLKGLHPGQRVEIEVDAYPDRVFEGRLESLSPASGALFSLLPPENATGNFTKVVQRLPVRVRLPADVAEQGLLRPGMSVVATIDTRADAGRDRTAAARR